MNITQSASMKAILVGGPCAGRTVDVLGRYYQASFERRFGKGNRYIDAVYEWELVEGGTYVGRFRGYFDGVHRVDSLGRRRKK